MRKELKYHYFYKITNNLNGHFYYGVHNTDNLNDGYMGSGRRLHYAYKKYGSENFTKDILKYFNSSKEAYEYEAEIVNENLVKDNNCYNIQLGGKGINTFGLVTVRDKNGYCFDIPKDDPRYLSGELVGITKGYNPYRNKITGEIKYFNINEVDKNIYEGITKNRLFVKDKYNNTYFIYNDDPRYLSGELVHYNTGKKWTETQKKSLKNTFKSIKHQQGEKNSQYGTCWINKDGNSIRIKKEELDKYLSEGWIKGRKYSNNELKKLHNNRKYSSEYTNGYNTIWIHNDLLKKSIYIKKELLDEYMSNGWEIGRKIKEYK